MLRDMIANTLLSFIKKHPWLVLLNVAMMAFVPINEVLLPYMYGKMINDILTNKAVLTLLTLGVVIATTQTGFLLRDKINEKFIPTLESFIKTEFIDIILDKYNTDFDTLTTGDIIYKMTKIPDIIIYWFQWINDYILPYMIVFLTAIIYFLRFDMVIATIFVTFLIVLISIFLITPKVCMKHAQSNDEVFSNLHEKLEDIIHNMPSIYSSNTKSQELEMLKESGTIYSHHFAKTASCTRNFKGFMIPFTTGLVVLFVLRSKYLIDNKLVNHKSFVPMFVVLTSMLSSIFWLIDIMRYSVFDIGCLTNMNDLLQKPKSKQRTIFNHRPPNEAIGLQNVTFSYKGRKILDNLSINFSTGQSTAIVGPIGAGKTTILKILLGFHIPQHGDAYLQGRWYRELNIRTIRNTIGYVPQNPVLFNNTVLYNIMYGNRTTEAEVTEFIKRLKIDPTFLNRQVGKNGMHLSGGQRQLVWCLRVFFKNPQVILMDEPTASMDQETKNTLLLLLSTLMKNRTVIIVTHDKYLLNHVDQIIRI